MTLEDRIKELGALDVNVWRRDGEQITEVYAVAADGVEFRVRSETALPEDIWFQRIWSMIDPKAFRAALTNT